MIFVQIFQNLLPSILWDEDSHPIHEENVVIWCLKGFKSAIYPGYLLGGVVLMQIAESVTVADCCKDGLVVLIPLSNINQFQQFRVQDDASSDEIYAALVNSAVLVMAGFIMDLNTAVEAGGAAQKISHQVFLVRDMFHSDIKPNYLFQEPPDVG